MYHSQMADGATTRKVPKGDGEQSSLQSRWLPRMGEIISLGFGLAGPRLISLITLPIAYALLGPSVVGQLAVIEATIVFIPVLGGMAFATYAQRFVTQHEHSKLVEVWESSLTVTLGLAAASTLAVTTINPTNIGLWYSGIFAAALQGTLPTWILRGSQNFRDYRRASLIQVAVSVATIILGLLAGWLPVYFLGNVTGYLAVLYIARNNDINFRPRRSLTVIRGAAMFVPSQAAIQVYVSIDVIIVRLFLGLEDAGRYATLYRLQYVFMALYAVVQQFLLPRLRLYSRRDEQEQKANHVLWFGALAFQWSLLTILVLTHNFLPSPYGPFWYVTAILLGQVSVATTGVLPVLITLTRNPRRYAAITVMGAGANIAANYALIPVAGLAGAAFATCTSELVVATLAALSTGRLSAVRSLLFGASLAAPLALFLSMGHPM